ncbi:hypothetical protein C8T65DRAFT_59734 [Cerioporus squamosus]|nr:hypothetical protein C8T65DRAFT_59734 [Cerioporus squamosus]
MSTPNISCIELKTVLVNTPDDVKEGLLTSLPCPIHLIEFSITQCPSLLYHPPNAILDLFYLFQTKMMQVELSGGWALDPMRDSMDNDISISPRWPICHQDICMKGIYHRRTAPFLALTNSLQPCSLQRLHLTFEQWSHLDEMARFLQYFGEYIKEFVITFAYSLIYYVKHDHAVKLAASVEEWASYSVSSLRALSKLGFNLSEPLVSRYLDEPRSWPDSIGIPRFLACFPQDLPLDDGIHIKLRFVDDIMERPIM